MASEDLITDIGQLQGPVLVFGGVYSNFQALEELAAIAESLDIPAGNIICTGDVVGYCADPEACCQFMKEWGVHTIAGNVEIQMREGMLDCGCSFAEGSRCDMFSKAWYPYAQLHTSVDSIAWMEGLPAFLRFEYAGKRVAVLHGSRFETAEYIFASTPWAVKQRNFEALQADVILSGHSGLPFSEEQEGSFWLNAGVIGMPANDGTTRVWYMVLDDTQGFAYRHASFEYDFDEAYVRMREKQLPIAYARTLETGLWDNNEILPAAETALQGVRIQL